MRAIAPEDILFTRQLVQHKGKPFFKRLPFVRTALPAAVICPCAAADYSSLFVQLRPTSVTRLQACLGGHLIRIHRAEDPEFDCIRVCLLHKKRMIATCLSAQNAESSESSTYLLGPPVCRCSKPTTQ